MTAAWAFRRAGQGSIALYDTMPSIKKGTRALRVRVKSEQGE
jgi:hypothetical protein